MGTPAYVSPESIKGEDTGVPADVWALGVMLYEALAGCRPFAGGSPLELVRRILDETPLAPSQVNPHATRAHDRVVLRALAKDPTQRYASVSELAREIDALRAETKAPRARARRARRGPSRVVAAGAGALALAGVVIAVVSTQSSPAPTVIAPPPVTEAPPPPVVHPVPPVLEAPPPPVDPPLVNPLLVPLTEAGQALAAFEPDRAERAADQALLLAPDSIEALFIRGQARDLRLDPGAWADLRKVAGSDDPTLAYEAWLLLAASDVQNAYAHLTEAMRVAPRRPEAFVARGLLELYGGRGKDGSPTCRGDIEKAVELAPDSVPALTTRGVLFWDDALRTEGLSEERRDALYEEAAQCYRRALELDPTAAETLSVRALLHRNRGGGDPAKQFADHAAALALFETQRGRALYFVEQARSARARGDLATAVAFAQRARGENRRHPLAVQELNVVGCMQWVAVIARPGDLSPADESQLLAFLKDGPRSTLHTVSSKLREVRLWQARVYLAPWSKRSVETARVDIDEVLVDHPDDADALALRARARLEQGETEGALDDALRALELAPPDSLAATEALAARDAARVKLGR